MNKEGAIARALPSLSAVMMPLRAVIEARSQATLLEICARSHMDTDRVVRVSRAVPSFLHDVSVDDAVGALHSGLRLRPDFGAHLENALSGRRRSIAGRGPSTAFGCRFALPHSAQDDRI